MMRALWSAATGMHAKQLDMDVIANNLANVNSAGYKKSRVDFQDLMYQTIRSAGSTVAQGSRVPTGIQVGLGTRAAAIQKVFSQGDFVQTENPLDMVIEGDGFFQVLMPDGSIAYTRTGAFKLDADSNAARTSASLRARPSSLYIFATITHSRAEPSSGRQRRKALLFLVDRSVMTRTSRVLSPRIGTSALTTSPSPHPIVYSPRLISTLTSLPVS
jgi:hypothetical protein